MSDCMDDGQLSPEEIQTIGETLQDSIAEMDTLEIFSLSDAPVHLAFKTDASSDIGCFTKYCNYESEEDISKLSVIYKGISYSFIRAMETTENYKSFALVSKECVNGEKKGMIVLVDLSGVIFVATCKVGLIGKFNLDFLSCIYSGN